MARPIDSVWKVIPGLPSRDIERTVKFYEEVLHFTVADVAHKRNGDKPDFCSIFAGDKAVVNLYFMKADEADFSPGWVVIAMGTTQVKELYEILRNDDRVQITEPIGNTDWGWERFTMRDLDENTLMFFRFLEGGNPGSE
ncbi:hypothetical protein HJFPF1_04022 [Paramyrothecium foliicola]|nr:hypothetical protein HJFPF1_04022 [Paramyrothecium foliicola]